MCNIGNMSRDFHISVIYYDIVGNCTIILFLASNVNLYMIMSQLFAAVSMYLFSQNYAEFINNMHGSLPDTYEWQLEVHSFTIHRNGLYYYSSGTYDNDNAHFNRVHNRFCVYFGEFGKNVIVT